MNRTLKWSLYLGGGAIVGLAVVVGGAALWMFQATELARAAIMESHEVDFPIPFPLTEDELAALRAEILSARTAPPEGQDPAASIAPEVQDPLAGVDLAALANQRAVARGKHLVEAVYACIECHGPDFAGGVMFDDPMVGQAFGSNLTLGAGSRTTAYGPKEWDRTVRHGIKPSGNPTIMPSEDYLGMTDRELSDIVSYIRSLPPVDKPSPEVKFGPLLTVLVATGQASFSAQKIADHQAAHAVDPPPVGPDAVYGAHILRACSGCHQSNFRGGPIPGAPPDWPPAADLTRPDGARSWTLDQFKAALQTGVAPDGRAFRAPMSLMVKYGRNLTDVEVQAMYAAIQALP